MAFATLRSKELVIGIGAVCGLLVLIANYYVDPTLNYISSQLKIWALLIAAFSWGVGFIRYIERTAKNAQQRKAGWIPGVFGVVLALVMTFFGVIFGTSVGTNYDWMFKFILTPARTAATALTAPFIFSAGYRAFRVRNVEATIFLFAGILVMLQAAPIGEVMWSGFPVIGKWILDVPSNAVNRAILITTGIGLVAWCFRYLFGFEKGITGEM
jgi:hypothetical protein